MHRKRWEGNAAKSNEIQFKRNIYFLFADCVLRVSQTDSVSHKAQNVFHFCLYLARNDGDDEDDNSNNNNAANVNKNVWLAESFWFA